MKTYVMCCTAGGERLHSAWSSIMNLMANMTDLDVHLVVNTAEVTEHQQDVELQLNGLARITSNTFTCHNFDRSISKAAMVSSVVKDWIAQTAPEDLNDTWLWNLDDDYFLPATSLDLVQRAMRATPYNCLIYGCFDVVNYKQFVTWTDRVHAPSELLDFVARIGMREAHNMLWDNSDGVLRLIDMPSHSTGSHVIRLSAFTPEVLTTLASWPKGQRGYDVYLCSNVGKIQWICGANMYHTDRTKVFLDGDLWTKDAYRPDLRLDGTNTSRALATELGQVGLPIVNVE